MQIISKKFNSYSSNYESTILAADFNSEINDKCRNDFFESHLIRELTCYKNLENPSCIDLFLTNSPNSFRILPNSPKILVWWRQVYLIIME